MQKLDLYKHGKYALIAIMCFSVNPTRADSNTYSSHDMQNWRGPYAGVNFGGIWGDMQHDETIGPSGTESSLSGGAQLGYNWQSDHFVYGVEGDFSKFDLASKSANLTFDEDWGVTMRGRLGYEMGKFLPYGTVGLALTDTHIEIPGIGSDSRVQPGLAAGGGIEMMFNDKWAGRLEYLYTDVPTYSTTLGGTTVKSGSQNDTIRVGLNYRF